MINSKAGMFLHHSYIFKKKRSIQVPGIIFPIKFCELIEESVRRPVLSSRMYHIDMSAKEYGIFSIRLDSE